MRKKRKTGRKSEIGKVNDNEREKRKVSREEVM